MVFLKRFRKPTKVITVGTKISEGESPFLVNQKLLAIFFIFFFWGAFANFGGRLKNQTGHRQKDATKRKKSAQFLVVTQS